MHGSIYAWDVFYRIIMTHTTATYMNPFRNLKIHLDQERHGPVGHRTARRLTHRDGVGHTIQLCS